MFHKFSRRLIVIPPSTENETAHAHMLQQMLNLMLEP
jgi:hypothetical protein